MARKVASGLFGRLKTTYAWASAPLDEGQAARGRAAEEEKERGGAQREADARAEQLLDLSTWGYGQRACNNSSSRGGGGGEGSAGGSGGGSGGGGQGGGQCGEGGDDDGVTIYEMHRVVQKGVFVSRRLAVTPGYLLCLRACGREAAKAEQLSRHTDVRSSTASEKDRVRVAECSVPWRWATVEGKYHLRQLSKITSRKMVKNLVVFHFKLDETSAAAGAAAAAAVSVSATGGDGGGDREGEGGDEEVAPATTNIPCILPESKTSIARVKRYYRMLLAQEKAASTAEAVVT